ncbi:MAG: hypothetical protein LQ340_003628 [Diploschistes diacapsis]|nr:MAG: hypothetical protein LQ340_003628 [Diploschistes diacapsis]
MREALRLGANFWNGGEFYGPPDANSLQLLNRYFTQYPEDADKVVLSIKGCLINFEPAGAPRDVRRSVENCVKLLDGKKKIDIFEPARVDKKVPIEETLGELKKLVEEGKIGGIGLSEVGPETIRRAAKVARIEGVETEVSLFEDQALTKGVAAACAEHGIPIIAYSPFSRGFLTGHVKNRDDLNMMQQRMPRFDEENFTKNLELVDKVQEIAKKHGATSAQYSLAWVAAQSEKDGMPLFVPIPGATTKERVAENFEIKKFKHQDFAQIDEFLKTFQVAGTRYPEAYMQHLET